MNEDLTLWNELAKLILKITWILMKIHVYRNRDNFWQNKVLILTNLSHQVHFFKKMKQLDLKAESRFGSDIHQESYILWPVQLVHFITLSCHSNQQWWEICLSLHPYREIHLSNQMWYISFILLTLPQKKFLFYSICWIWLTLQWIWTWEPVKHWFFFVPIKTKLVIIH